MFNISENPIQGRSGNSMNLNDSPRMSVKIHSLDSSKLRKKKSNKDQEYYGQSPTGTTTTFSKFIHGKDDSCNDNEELTIIMSDTESNDEVEDRTLKNATSELPKTFASFFKEKKRMPSYDVTFSHGPIGLELETDWYGRQAVVKGFKTIGGSDGLAKQCGLIYIGDVLTSINGKSCLELSFQETLSLLREAGKSEHTLHFKTLETIGDLSHYVGGGQLAEARKYIHRHKMHFYSPSEETELIYGCIERHRGVHVTSYNFHREDTGEFVMACSSLSDSTGDFVFHTIQDSHLRELKDIPQNADSAVYLGVMRANFLGTVFTINDHRLGDTSFVSSFSSNNSKDLALITYETNVLGRVPNILKMIIPRSSQVSSEEINTSSNISDRYKLLQRRRQIGSVIERLKSFSFDQIRDAISDENLPSYRRSNSEANPQGAQRTNGPELTEHLHYGAVEQEDHSDLLVFQTKKPTWNESLCAWTLNFSGRVNLASKKNFLLVAEVGNDRMEEEFGEDQLFLRFGKLTKTRFTLDYRAPLSPIVALGIACTTFANKLAVT